MVRCWRYEMVVPPRTLCSTSIIARYGASVVPTLSKKVWKHVVAVEISDRLPLTKHGKLTRLPSWMIWEVDWSETKTLRIENKSKAEMGPVNLQMVMVTNHNYIMIKIKYNMQYKCYKFTYIISVMTNSLNIFWRLCWLFIFLSTFFNEYKQGITSPTYCLLQS